MKDLQQSGGSSEARIRRTLWGLGLFLLTLLAYLPVWKAGYIWDDNVYLTANPCIVGHKGLWDIWTTWEAQICPLTQTTYWILHRLFGLHPLPYHLVNVLQHGTAALLLWRVLGQLRVRGAWLGAALWALHPVQVESVAWVTEMRNTQSAVFFLLAVSAYLRSLGKPTRRTQLLVLLYALLAMASKSSTVVLPAVLALCAWWREGHWRWRHARLIGAVGLIAVLASGVSILGQSTIWTHSQTAKLAMALPWSFSGRILNASHALEFYLCKLVWPHPLIAIYPRMANSWGWLVAELLAGMLLLRWRQGRDRAVLFALGYFGICLLPMLGLVNFSFLFYATVADRFQYLASMGPLALLGAGLASIPQMWPPVEVKVVRAVAATLLCVLGFLAWQQAGCYRSSVALWSHTLEENPQCWTAYNFLGFDKQRHGNLPGAIADWNTAISLFPDNVQGHLSLSEILDQVGRKDEALWHARRAVALLPTYTVAHFTLANVLQSMGQTTEAAIEYQRAALLDPDFTTPLPQRAHRR